MGTHVERERQAVVRRHPGRSGSGHQAARLARREDTGKRRGEHPGLRAAQHAQHAAGNCPAVPRRHRLQHPVHAASVRRQDDPHRQVTRTQGAGRGPDPAHVPLEIRYWSTTPYRFGANRVVKYSLLPTSDATSALPPPLADDYLSAAMETRLSREGVSFALAVQVRADGMPVHDAAPRWDETVSPFQTVATLTIPAQVFRTPERGRRSEELSFSPALPMQFIHEEDVGQAFVLCTVATGPPGAYNITGDGVVTAIDVARELGFIPIPLPAGPFHSAARVVSALPALPPAAQWLEACGAPGGSLSAYRHRPAGSFPARLRPDRRSRAGRRHRPARPVRRRRRRLQVLHRPGAQGLRDRRHRPQTRADEQGRTLAAAHHTDPRRRPRPQTRPPAGQNLLHPDDRTRRRPPESHLRGRRPPGRTRLGRDGPRHALCDLRQRRKPVTPEDARKIIAERWTVPEEVRKRRRSSKQKGKAPQQALRPGTRGDLPRSRSSSPPRRVKHNS